jgi:OOP family OmpA-OmpF porin
LKKRYPFVLGLALLPACTKQSSSDARLSATYQAQNPNILSLDKDGYAKTDTQGLFDEDVEAFILVEESNPFAENEEKAMGDALFIVEDKENPTTNYHANQHQLKTVYFEFDQYSLDEHQKKILDYNVPFLREACKQGSSIVVEGHACNSAGSDVYNLMLSEKRAKTITDYLVEQGIPAHKISTVGRGSELCIVPHGNRAQQAPNRRVEFHAFT